ncbi:MAG TPA: VCBS repeat-containing protein [Terriglobales bacterium]|nr:VCBS repeat-containing protein [Terriglobales bacterium]
MTLRLFRNIVIYACAIVAYTGSAAATVSFTTTTSFLPSSGNLAPDLRGIVAADFNGDGIHDLVMVDRTAKVFMYFQGRGDGTFLDPVSMSTGVTSLPPDAIVAADFNGDGKLDIAVTLSTEDSGILAPFVGDQVELFLGDGAGHFSAGPVITDTGTGADSLASGDFNGDGIPDLAVGASGDQAVWIYRGNGDGTFNPPSRFPIATLGRTTLEVAAADINHDGHIDIVAVGSGTMTTLLGDGMGGFTITAPMATTGAGFPQIALADVNEDGNLDAVVVSRSTGDSIFVDIFFGTGAGSFSLARTLPLTGKFPGAVALALADFDSDRHVDIAVGRDGIISILTGDGAGNFPAQYDFAGNNENLQARRMVAADFNRDGRPDLIATSGPEISLLINTSPPSCTDTVDLTYSAGTLNLGFTLMSPQPAIWSTWLASQNSVVNLWLAPIPAVTPAVSLNVPIPGFPMIGNVGVLTVLNNQDSGMVCFDWKTVDTCGVGATPQELRNQIIKNGIMDSLP